MINSGFLFKFWQDNIVDSGELVMYNYSVA